MAITKFNIEGVGVVPVGADAQDVTYGDSSNVKVALDSANSRLTNLEGTTAVTLGSRNLYDKSDTSQRLDDYNLNNDAITALSDNNSFALAKVPVKASTDYIIYNADGLWGGNRRYAFFDSSNIIIGTTHTWTVPSDASPEYAGADIPIDNYHRRITTPDGCAFLVVQTAAIGNSDWSAFDIRNSLMVEEGSYPSEYDAGNGEFIEKINGKRIRAVDNDRERKYDIPLNTYVLGDSTATYTEGVWPQNLVNKFSFKHFYGLAKGAATWGIRKDAVAADIEAGDNSDMENNNLLAQFYKLVDLVDNSNKPTPELIIMHAGTNDVTAEFANSSNAMADNANYTEVGDADETFDYSDADYRDWSSISIIDDRTNTAIGGMRLTIEKIRAKWPYCKILVTTPLQRATNVSGDYQLLTIYRKCVEQIRKAAWYMGVPCLDLSAESGITVFNLGTFTKDSVHPNANGGLRLADVIGRYLVAHYGFKKDWFS